MIYLNIQNESAMKTSTFDFNAEVVAYRDQLRYFALSLTSDGHDADDLVQETMLKAFTYRSHFAEDTNLKAWLYTIMKNIFINNYRKNTRVKLITDNSKDLYFLNIPETRKGFDPETRFHYKELAGLMMQLDEEYKVPLRMYFEGYKYKEIAEEMGLPIGTVKSRIFLARKQLAGALVEH